jgi:DNA polymerase III subunit gamma/tau
MSYVVLARKWRPAIFEDVIAQSHVTVTLQNAVRAGRIAHAYLFAGPRGSGKTTTARILAKALNCDHGPTPTPCNRCRACESINRGTSPDVLEIDAASNRGIDEIRSLREKVIIGVSKQTGHKVYIIDEVHMLTQEAFNALLKTLEEPPSHVTFILATTEGHRVPTTILSRCQRFNFRRIPSEDIARQLAHIAREEGIDIPEAGLFLIARRADGAMRDAQSLLDQVLAYAGTSLTEAVVREALGILDQSLFFRATEAILGRDRAAGLDLIESAIAEGGDVGEFVRGLLEHLCHMLICKVRGGAGSLDLSDADRGRYEAAAEGFTEADLQRMIRVISDLEREIAGVAQPRLHLEVALLRLIGMERAVSADELLDRLDRLEERIRQGAPALAPPAPSAPPEPTPVPPPRKVAQAPVAPESAAAAPPETPAPSAAPGGSLSMERILQVWPEVVGRAKTGSISLGTHLEAGTPCALAGQILKVAFPQRSTFSADHIRRKKKVLEEILSEVVGIRLRVEPQLVENGEADPATQAPTAGAAPEPEAKGEVSPSVQTVLQIFDGEILRR